MKTKVYVLCDDNGAIRYVGRTCRKLSQRLCEHLLEARLGKRSHRHHWIRSLLSLGCVPGIRLIAEVDGDGYASEQNWIEYLKELGVHLVNATDGGAGPIGHKHSQENVAKMRKRLMGNKNAIGHTVSPAVREILRAKSTGRPKTPEEIEKIRSALKGRVFSTDHRKKISASKKGHALSSQGRAKVSRANKGRKHTDQARAKISAGLLRHHAADNEG